MVDVGPPGAGPARRRDAAALAGLAALFVPYALAARRLWWSGDDPALLRFVHHHPGADYLWSSAAWQELPWRVFAPLQLADFQLDAALFGVASPSGFYAHHLAVLTAAAVALHLLLRRFWGAGRSFLAVALLLAGPPLPATLLRLADRHYVFGLLLALLALHAHLGGRGGDEPPPAWRRAAGALLYLAAMAAKEIYVPLLLVAILLIPGGWRNRLRATAPWFAALAAYLGWRWALLGEPFGGAGLIAGTGGLPAAALRLPAALAERLLGTAGPWGWLLAAALLLATVATARAGDAGERGRRMIAAALLAAAALLPILPTAAILAERHVLLPWLLCALLVARAAGHGRLGRAAAALALVAVAASSVTAGRQQVDELARQGHEGRFALTHDAGHLLRRPAAPAYYLGDVGWLARRLGTDGPAGHFADDYYLCSHDLTGHTLWAWDAARGEIVDETARAAELRAAHCGRLRDDVVLAVRFERGADGLAWELGPFDDGTWAFLVDDGRARFEVPPAGHLRGPAFAGRRVRVLYESPAGWLAVSPTL